jgi:hypothetical protein
VRHACLVCGRISDRPRCPDHQRGSPQERGYGRHFEQARAKLLALTRSAGVADGRRLLITDQPGAYWSQWASPIPMMSRSSRASAPPATLEKPPPADSRKARIENDGRPAPVELACYRRAVQCPHAVIGRGQRSFRLRRATRGGGSRPVLRRLVKERFSVLEVDAVALLIDDDPRPVLLMLSHGAWSG